MIQQRSYAGKSLFQAMMIERGRFSRRQVLLGMVALSVGGSGCGSQVPPPGSINRNSFEGKLLYTHKGTYSIHRIAWSPDSKYIASCNNAKTQVWNATNGHHVYTYEGHWSLTDLPPMVWQVAWSPDSTRIASAGSDKTVQVWGATDGS